MLKLPIYLDHNATTPCDARVVDAMMPYFSQYFGNAASRNHVFGWQAGEAVQQARERVAGLIGAGETEVIFTSGATESVNLALKGIFEAYSVRGNHIVTSNIEHKAVLDTCDHLSKHGAEITYLPVKENGLIDPGELESAIRPTTVLVAIMFANNEIGTLMPIKEVSKITRKKGALLFSDATQAVGKIPVDVDADGVDIMAFNAHKMYGPKGVGALYVRRKNPRVKIIAQMDGGGHERELRSGTLNVPAIVGFGKACEIAAQEMINFAEKAEKLRNELESGLLTMDDVFLNGDPEHRLPHVSNLSFRYADSEVLIANLSSSIAISTGSACMSASLEPSYVLKAIGRSEEMARSSLRFSLGRNTTGEEIKYTIEQVMGTVQKLRETRIASLK